MYVETSLVAQWLRLWASNAESVGSIPGHRTKIPHMPCSSFQKKKKRKKIIIKETYATMVGSHKGYKDK